MNGTGGLAVSDDLISRKALIEELVELRQKEYCDDDAMAYTYVLAIVEKGGIE